MFVAFYLWNQRYAASYLFISILPYAVIYMLVCLTSFYYFGLYDFQFSIKPFDCFFRVFLAIVAAAIFFSTFHYFFPYFLPTEPVKRQLMLFTSLMCIINGCVSRYLYFMFISSKTLDEKLLIVGGGEFAKQTAQLVLSRKDLKHKIIGFLDSNKSKIGLSLVNPTILGLYEDVYSIAKQHDVNRIIVALEDRRGNLPIDGLMHCKLNGVYVEDAVHFYERLSGKLFIENLTPSNLIFADGFCVSPTKLKIKRLCDIALSSLMLFVTSPILLLIAVLIKMESRGSCIFKQERVGENGNIFYIYKFRTMPTDAE